MRAYSSRRRILLVDDSALVHELVEVALAGAGWEVAHASSGAHALELADEAPLDAAVVDVEMPGMDGPATVRALRDRPAGRELPILFLTGHEDPADRARLATLDVAGVIGKPFDVAGLAGEVAAALGWDR